MFKEIIQHEYFRWFILPLASFLGSTLLSGIFFAIGYGFLKDYGFWTGLVVLICSVIYIFSFVQIGIWIAPVKSFTIQKVIAYPLLLVSLSQIIFWFCWITDISGCYLLQDFRFTPFIKSGFPYAWAVTRKLSVGWETFLIALGFTFSTITCLRNDDIFDFTF